MVKVLSPGHLRFAQLYLAHPPLLNDLCVSAVNDFSGTLQENRRPESYVHISETAKIVTETRDIELCPTEIAGHTVATLASPRTERNLSRGSTWQTLPTASRLLFDLRS